MFGIWLFLLFLRFSSFSTAQAPSPSLPLQSAAITLGGTTKLKIANHTVVSLVNPGNEISLFFSEFGDPIPADELCHTLSVASVRVQAYLPRYADDPISDSFFEETIPFPATRDSVSLCVYAYGHGLSWLQLSQGLTILQEYMLGIGPGHPHAHSQQLDFYVQIAAGTEVAHGVVGFAPGARTVAKRNLMTLQLPPVNFSSPSILTRPIIFNIPKTNLDLTITSLGPLIPQTTILDTIESAFTEIVLNHTDIDSPMPAHQPFSFTATSGKSSQLYETVIMIFPDFGERMSWGLVCILIYGLKDFMIETDHFNAVNFEINDGRLGRIGYGDVLYGPSAAETASAEKLESE